MPHNMTDIDWTAVADRLFSEGNALEKVSPVAATVLSSISFAIRDGLDSVAATKKAEQDARALAEEIEAERRWKDG